MAAIDPRFAFMYNWSFDDYNDYASIKVKLPSMQLDWKIDVDVESSSVFVSINNSNVPLICGQTFSKFKQFKEEIFEDFVEFTFTKQQPEEWSLFIREVSDKYHTIDPKSAFELYIATSSQDIDDVRFVQIRQNLFDYTLNVCYPQAMLHKAKAYSSVPGREKESLLLIQRAAIIYKDPDAQIAYAVATMSNPRYSDESFQCLEMALHAGNLAAFSPMAIMLSPATSIPYKKDAQKAADYFERAIRYNPQDVYALTGYAELLLEGKGILINEKRANELYQAARKIDPDLPPLKKTSGYTALFIGAGFLAAATAIALYTFRRNSQK